MKVIDGHTHVHPRYARLAVETMDQAGVETMITLEWHDGFGVSLGEHLQTFNAYPGRFVVFGNIDFSRINEPGFGTVAAKQMERDVEAGMKGLKVYKALGLDYANDDGSLVRVNDERLDPVWAKAGELGIPVLIHTADPIAFWQPVNQQNFWGGVLYGEYGWWSYYRKEVPSRDELIAERNDVIRRHADTTFIAPHIGSRADAPQTAADDLDALPNLCYDISARIPILGLPAHAQTTKKLFTRYADRVIFGTDLIYDDANVPTGVQAQSLYQPFEIPLDGVDPEAKYVETSAMFVRSHIDFLATDRLQKRPPFKRNADGFTIQGLDLPVDVLEQICWKNITRILSA